MNLKEKRTEVADLRIKESEELKNNISGKIEDIVNRILEGAVAARDFTNNGVIDLNMTYSIDERAESFALSRDNNTIVMPALKRLLPSDLQ